MKKEYTIDCNEYMKVLGDLAFEASISFNEVCKIFTKSKNKGKIAVVELLQLAGGDIQIFTFLSIELGVRPKDVYDLAEAGRILLVSNNEVNHVE